MLMSLLLWMYQCTTEKKYIHQHMFCNFLSGLYQFSLPFHLFCIPLCISLLHVVILSLLESSQYYLAVFGFTFLSMNGEQSTRDIMNILLSHQDTGSFTINNIFNPHRPRISIIRDFYDAVSQTNASRNGFECNLAST